MATLEELHYSIKLKDLGTVRSVLSKLQTEKLNLCLRSATALSVAVLQGSIDAVQILLANGADPNRLSKDHQGRVETPLFTACRLGHEEIAKVLILEHNADVNTADFYGHSPLWMSTKERRVDLVRLLVENGAVLSSHKATHAALYLATKYMGRERIAVLLIQHGCQLNLADNEGHSILYWLLLNNQLEVFKLAILAGAYVDSRLRSYLSSEKSLSADIRQNKEFRCWLQHQLNNASSLKLCSIRTIRTQLRLVSRGSSIHQRIKQLQLPQHIEVQLCLEHLFTDHKASRCD